MPEPHAVSTALPISQFDKALHDCSAFSCGFLPIDNFLKDALADHINSGYLTAYVATEEGQKDVVGVYTLNAFAIKPDHIETPKEPRPPPTIPAIYMKVVAVREDRQGMGLGKALMVNALRKSLEISKDVGSMAVVLDVLRDENFERRFAFYKNLGFQPLNDPKNADRVYISLNDVAATLSN